MTTYESVCIPILVTMFPKWLSRKRTIDAHTQRHASVLVVFVVFCLHMHSFAGLIRRMPPPTFSDTAICHSDTTIFQLRAHWMRISLSIGLEKSFGHVPPVGGKNSTSCVQREHPIHWARLSTTPYDMFDCIFICFELEIHVLLEKELLETS